MLPFRIESDNRKNFVGASKKLLREFSNFIKVVTTDIAGKYSTQGFEWRFITPHAPHMGGLWESVLKRFNLYFKPKAGAHRFTFEQFAIVLARMEGVPNSRPNSALLKIIQIPQP